MYTHNVRSPVVCVRVAKETRSVSRRSHDTSCSANVLSLSLASLLLSDFPPRGPGNCSQPVSTVFTAVWGVFSLTHKHFFLGGWVKPRTLVLFMVFVCQCACMCEIFIITSSYKVSHENLPCTPFSNQFTASDEDEIMYTLDFTFSLHTIHFSFECKFFNN